MRKVGLHMKTYDNMLSGHQSGSVWLMPWDGLLCSVPGQK